MALQVLLNNSFQHPLPLAMLTRVAGTCCSATSGASEYHLPLSVFQITLLCCHFSFLVHHPCFVFQHVWSESEDCLPFLQLAQDYISSCGKKTLHEILEKVFKSFRPVSAHFLFQWFRSSTLGEHNIFLLLLINCLAKHTKINVYFLTLYFLHLWSSILQAPCWGRNRPYWLPSQVGNCEVWSLNVGSEEL